MRTLLQTTVVCVGLACTGVAVAGPGPAARAKYENAAKLNDNGDFEKALELVEQGLALAPKDLDLLGLKGTVLIKLRDYTGALAVYQSYLEAGATGGNRRQAQKIVESLGAVKSTFLEVSLANGPADIYLDSKTQGLFCRAAPSCNKPLLPGEYRAIAERPGFERWIGRAIAENGKTTRLSITLVEQPSPLAVRVEPPGARIMVDGAAYDAQTRAAAGKHRVMVSLKGHATEWREVTAQQGKPIELAVVLAPLVPIRVEPPGAELLVDGKPAAIEDGGIAVSRGAHTLVARAGGFRDHQIEIPAERGSDYRLAVELERLPVFTFQRKLALAVGDLGVVAAGAGVLLGIQAEKLKRDPSTADRGDRRSFESTLAYGFSLLAAGAAINLWIGGAPRSRVAITPRVGEISGIELAARF